MNGNTFSKAKSVTVISVCVCKLQVSALAVLRGERFDEEQSLLSTIIDQQKEKPPNPPTYRGFQVL